MKKFFVLLATMPLLSGISLTRQNIPRWEKHSFKLHSDACVGKRKRRWKLFGRQAVNPTSMRYILSICLLFVSAITSAQVDSVSLKEAMANLDQALETKDEKALVQLLHNDVSYGHSNGWVQNKADIVNDLKSGKLVYTKLDNISVTIAAINKDWATARITTNAEGIVNGNSFQFKLHILQVWLKTKTGWQLLARQSTKL